MIAALEPAVVAVIVTVAVILAAGLVSGWLRNALRGWRDDLAGLDALDSERSPTDDPDSELREEVRQLVVADNLRRARRGEPPRDVDDEVERRLRELGQGL